VLTRVRATERPVVIPARVVTAAGAALVSFGLLAIGAQVMPYLPQSADCWADAGAADEAAMRAPKAAVERSNLI
jgi:hypothetical protein